MTLASASAFTPLVRTEALPFASDAVLLGVPLRFESNADRVMERITQFLADHGGKMVSAPHVPLPLTIKCLVREQGTPDNITLPQYVSGNAGRLSLQSAHVSGVVDPGLCESIAHVSDVYVDAPEFQEHILEAITFALIACFDRHPLHASAIVHDGRALLFAGPSGAGKSTLAQLGVSAGYKLLAEDRVWIQRDPALRVWGSSSFIRIATNGQGKGLIATPNDQRVSHADSAS